LDYFCKEKDVTALAAVLKHLDCSCSGVKYSNQPKINIEIV
jgi:hypothetical protein